MLTPRACAGEPSVLELAACRRRGRVGRAIAGFQRGLRRLVRGAGRRRSRPCRATRSAPASSWRWPATCGWWPTTRGSPCARPSSAWCPTWPARRRWSTWSATRAPWRSARPGAVGARGRGRAASGWPQVAVPAGGARRHRRATWPAALLAAPDGGGARDQAAAAAARVDATPRPSGGRAGGTGAAAGRHDREPRGSSTPDGRCQTATTIRSRTPADAWARKAERRPMSMSGWQMMRSLTRDSSRGAAQAGARHGARVVGYARPYRRQIARSWCSW